MTAWILTFPAAGAVAALMYFLMKFVFQMP